MKLNIDFHPKLFSSLKNYNREKFATDLMAGLNVGIVALPLCIAFGIGSGVSPEKGLITAIIGGFITSLLGGSTVQISGPTGAFMLVVAGVVAQYGFEGLAVATIMAGIMLLAMGLFKMGVVIKFIPYPIIVGFTSGIAVTIFTSQIKDFFGLTITEPIPGDFFGKWMAYFRNFDTINLWALGAGILTILIIVFAPRLSRKLPGSLMAILVITIIAWLAKRYCGVTGIETIGDRFTIDPTIPAPHGFNINLDIINQLLPVAFTMAMLSAMVSLLSATVADGAIGERHNSNTELIAQGAANIVTPLFGGIPIMGAIARTMTNINNGGRTPVAGMAHAVVLLIIFVFLSPLMKHIPTACLAGILVVVSYNMSEWRTIKALMKNPKSDVAVLITTLLLTVLFDLTIAIIAGLAMAVVLFMKRIMETTNISVIRKQIDINDDAETGGDLECIDLANGVEVYEIDGPFFFGVANKFDEQMRKLGERSSVRIIRMRKVPFIDSTGMHNLEILIRSSQKEGITIILSGVIPSVRRTLVKGDIDKLVGVENICDNIHIAARRANQIATEAEEEKNT